MRLFHRTPLLLIILIEGYAVLATELLAIRELIPFVGSGTEVIAIIISAVLLPLAIGYHIGGHRRARLRATLVRNVLMALLILTFGLSYVFLELFFGALGQIGVTAAVAQAACYAVLFLSWPVFLLGQTVPLVSNYFPQARLSALTGRMLFFSTVGSFLGSVFSTLVLMNTIGVHYTVVVTLCLLGLLVPLLARRTLCYETCLAAMLLLGGLALNSDAAMRKLGVVSNNSYNIVAVMEDTKTQDRFLQINRSYSSGLSKDGKRIFPYLQYIEQIFVTPTLKEDQPPREMLVIGAGGFTMGLDDTKNHYTFVDIDPALKTVAENYFLRAKLSANKQFVPSSARAFLGRTQAQYDFILVDTYTHVLSVPMETTTEEFLQAVKARLKPGGVMVVNQVSSPDLRDRFSVRYDQTFAHVFPHYTRQVIGDFNPWDAVQGPAQWRNVLYIYYDRPNINERVSYTDDRNTYSIDRR